MDDAEELGNRFKKYPHDLYQNLISKPGSYSKQGSLKSSTYTEHST